MTICEVCSHYADTPDTIWLRVSPVAAHVGCTAATCTTIAALEGK